MNNEGLSSVPSPSDAIQKVVIVTDSIAQIPFDITQQLGIRIMPFTVTVKDVTYTDSVDLDPGDLYQRMRQDKDLRLSTSAPSSGQYYQTFKDCHEQGVKIVLYIGVSSRLSMAIGAAEEASQMIRDENNSLQIKIFDSRMATMAQGFLAIDAARLASKGATINDILEHLEVERKRIGFAAGLETLEYLARGGRIGKAAYMISNAIQILPVVSISDEGVVAPVSRSLGYHNMMKDIIHFVAHEAAGHSHLTLAVMHADARQRAEELQAMAIEQFHPEEIFITDFTPVMVAHTGPGIIGLAYHWWK